MNEKRVLVSGSSRGIGREIARRGLDREKFLDMGMKPIASGVLDPKTLEGHKAHFIAGHGGYPLVGTATQIVDELGKLADIGVDGCLVGGDARPCVACDGRVSEARSCGRRGRQSAR